VYWNNTSLSGEPTATDRETELDHDWGTGSPHANVNADRFSARWTRYIDVSAGAYRFTATSDDGIRVYVDDKLIIDQWYDQPPQTFTADISLTADHHLVKVEYYENRGGAVAKVSWEPVSAPSDGWHGEYFDNRWLSGSPALERHDAKLDFNWGYGSPATSIPSDGFSVRWRRTAHFDASAYRFAATADDGIRVFVDGRLVVDGGWYDHPARTFVGEISLAEGDHEVVVEYYENTGLASAKVSWGPTAAPSNVWRGEYFDNPSLSAAPLLTLKDARIDFDWGYRSPAREIPNDRFSVRWTRELHFEPGTYRFTATTDDGVRLWVNEHLLIDNWRDQAFTARSGTIYLEGNVPLKMEYYENGGVAAARLTWEREGENPLPPDDVIVDDTDPGFVKGGPAYAWGTAAEGYSGHLTWARNRAWAVRNQWPGYNWGRWYPDLTSGRYEVFVYIPERYTTSADARYWVKHRDGLTLRVVDQSVNGDRWVSLDTYWFNGDGEDRVSLATPTHEPHRSRLLAFDAVKWVSR
jgi:hypothetical protein